VDRKQKHGQLLDKWKNERPEYGIKYPFCQDGPSDWDKYLQEIPKTLFLLKEPRLEYTPGEPNYIYGQKGHNMVRWSYLIKQLYQNRGSEIKMPDDWTLKTLSEHRYHHFAEIELKKRNDERSKSSDGDIWTYAKNDAHFLDRQIELIDPQVIVCCGNFYGYCLIFQNDAGTNQFTTLVKNEKQSYKHRNRLIIDFNHPSYSQIRGGNATHIRLLHLALDNGKVFDQFEW